MQTSELLTVAETARRLGLREPTIREWLRQRRLDKVRVGTRSIRVPAQAVEQLIAEGFVPARRRLSSVRHAGSPDGAVRQPAGGAAREG